MKMIELLNEAVKTNTSDIFIIAGCPISFKVNGQLTHLNEEKLTPTMTQELIQDIYALSFERSMQRVEKKGEDDFSFSLSDMARFRVNVYRQRGSLAAVLRVVKFTLPNAIDLGISDEIMKLSELKKGLVLVTGAAGSGKSTSLACLINELNQNRSGHIITIEDPIEYLHRHQKSIVSQREIGQDTTDYLHALTSVLREAPDVILVGEMRDLETIQIVLSAAETGHLVFSSLHTPGAANTINRIIDVFPAEKQQQIRVQLSMVLQAIVSQQLVPDVNGKLIPVFEIMKINTAIETLIRENKIHQIDNAISSQSKLGMSTMDNSLIKLVEEKKISAQTALSNSSDPEMMRRKLNLV